MAVAALAAPGVVGGSGVAGLAVRVAGMEEGVIRPILYGMAVRTLAGPVAVDAVAGAAVAQPAVVDLRHFPAGDCVTCRALSGVMFTGAGVAGQAVDQPTVVEVNGAPALCAVALAAQTGVVPAGRVVA